MKTTTAIAVLLAIFITMPISFYLQYKILTTIQASELMMFLYWVNLPLLIFIQIILKVGSDKK
jgi:hypothetical protein